VVASVARSAAASSALASDMAPTAADAAAAQTRSRTDWSKAANDLARHSKDAAAKEPGSAPGKFKLRLKKASEGMQEELSIAEQGLKNRSELDVSFVSDENTSAQDSPEKTRAHSPFDEREMLSRSVLASHALPSPEPAEDDAALRSANATPLSEGCFEDIPKRRGTEAAMEPRVDKSRRAFVV